MTHEQAEIDQANAQADEENARGDREVAAQRATLRQYASETPLWVGSYRTTRPGDHTC